MMIFVPLFGAKGGQISSFIVMTSAIGTTTSLIFAGFRVIEYAAQQDYFPYISHELKWATKEKSPRNALIVQFMWCSLLIILVKDKTTSDFYGSFSNFSWYSSLTIYVLKGFVLLLLQLTSKTKKLRFYKKDYNILILLSIVG